MLYLLLGPANLTRNIMQTFKFTRILQQAVLDNFLKKEGQEADFSGYEVTT